jgi:hypothetical protein
MNAAQDDVPPWFFNAVVSGLQFMWALGLPGTPASDLATLTAQAWVQALHSAPFAWNEEQDRARLQEAFKAAASQAERWPTPRAVLNALPPRPVRAALPGPSLQAIPPSVREKMRRLGSRHTPPLKEAQP